MDDQNQNNQHLDQVVSSGPTPPSLPVPPSSPIEDITPVTDVPVTPTTPEPIVPPQAQTASFASSYSAPIPSPDPVSIPPIAEPTNLPPQAEPINTTTPEPTTVPIPTPDEPAMPPIKTKKKISPVIGALVGLLFVAGVAGAAYYVSNQLSTRQAIAPNAPESKPLAFTCSTTCPSYNPCLSEGCGCGQAFCGGCINACRDISYQTCNQLIASECSGDGGGGGGGGGGTCPSIPNIGSSGPEGSACGPSNCAGGSCGVYTFKCGSLCYQASCGAAACVDPTCDASRRDTPSSKTITFGKTGKVIPFIRGGEAGTLTLTKTGSTISIPLTTGNATQLNSFNVNAGDVYTITVKLSSPREQGKDAYGWIPNKSTNICGPVKAPGDSIDGNSRSTGLCGPEVDITAVRDLARAKVDLTDITAGGANATIQCWGDAELGDATQDYDYNDFTLVFGYEKATQITDLSLIKKAIKNDPRNVPGIYYIGEEVTTVTKGQIILYYLHYENIGTTKIDSIKFTDPLIEGNLNHLTFLDAQAGCIYNSTKKEIECNVGEIKAGQGSAFAFRVRVNDTVTNNMLIHNTATAVFGTKTKTASVDVTANVPAIPDVTWNITAVPVCPTNMKPKATIRMFRIIWPKANPTSPQEFDCVNDQPSSALSHSMTIKTDRIINLQGIYVGLEGVAGPTTDTNCSAEGTVGFEPKSMYKAGEPVLALPGGNNPPATGDYVGFGKWFNPLTWMTHWYYNRLAAGSYTINYQVPESYCETIITGDTCSQLKVYKKEADGSYGTTPLTATQLNELKTGNVLRFSWTANVDNLQGRVRATISSSSATPTPGEWLVGTLDATNKKLFTYDGYVVSVPGNYSFEAQVKESVNIIQQ